MRKKKTIKIYFNGTHLILIQILLMTFPFISLFALTRSLIFMLLTLFYRFSSFAETSMDQDVYNAYSKQQIESSLTTDGGGELKTEHFPIELTNLIGEYFT